MRYEPAPDLQEQTNLIAIKLFPHVKIDRLKCFRSYGSSSRNTVARCHTIGKLMQKTIGVKAHYAIEFLTEQFETLNPEEKTKVIIHELMHIPATFGGGFRHHDYVCEKNIKVFYKQLKNMDNEQKNKSWF